jgi:hypothetical protein
LRPGILLVALGLLVSLVLLLPGSVQAQGNSEAAKACQHGGWQHLQTSDGKPFANQQECVTAGAQGAVLEPKGSIGITFTASDTSGQCLATVTLTGFAPNTTYPLTVQVFALFGGSADETTITTDSGGGATYTWRSDIPASGYEAEAHIGTFESIGTNSSGWIPVAC